MKVSATVLSVKELNLCLFALIVQSGKMAETRFCRQIGISGSKLEKRTTRGCGGRICILQDMNPTACLHSSDRGAAFAL